MNRADMKKAARELNGVLGLDPPIDYNLEDEELRNRLLFAWVLRAPEDEISDSTTSVVEELLGELEDETMADRIRKASQTGEVPDEEVDALSALLLKTKPEEEEGQQTSVEKEEDPPPAAADEESEEEGEPTVNRKKTTAKKKTAKAPTAKKKTKATRPSTPKETGYKGHRPGSIKEKAHQAADGFKGKDPSKLIDQIEKLGVKRTTAKSWVAEFRRAEG